MQKWFYAYEVFDGETFKHRYSGIYPQDGVFREMNILGIDNSNPYEVLKHLEGMEKMHGDGISVFFTAFNPI